MTTSMILSICEYLYYQAIETLVTLLLLLIIYHYITSHLLLFNSNDNNTRVKDDVESMIEQQIENTNRSTFNCRDHQDSLYGGESCTLCAITIHPHTGPLQSKRRIAQRKRRRLQKRQQVVSTRTTTTTKQNQKKGEQMVQQEVEDVGVMIEGMKSFSLQEHSCRSTGTLVNIASYDQNHSSASTKKDLKEDFVLIATRQRASAPMGGTFKSQFMEEPIDQIATTATTTNNTIQVGKQVQQQQQQREEMDPIEYVKQLHRKDFLDMLASGKIAQSEEVIAEEQNVNNERLETTEQIDVTSTEQSVTLSPSIELEQQQQQQIQEEPQQVLQAEQVEEIIIEEHTEEAQKQPPVPNHFLHRYFSFNNGSITRSASMEAISMSQRTPIDVRRYSDNTVTTSTSDSQDECTASSSTRSRPGSEDNLSIGASKPLKRKSSLSKVKKAARFVKRKLDEHTWIAGPIGGTRSH